jgi:hypothetical protein
LDEGGVKGRRIIVVVIGSIELLGDLGLVHEGLVELVELVGVLVLDVLDIVVDSVIVFDFGEDIAVSAVGVNAGVEPVSTGPKLSVRRIH